MEFLYQENPNRDVLERWLAHVEQSIEWQRDDEKSRLAMGFAKAAIKSRIVNPDTHHVVGVARMEETINDYSSLDVSFSKNLVGVHGYSIVNRDAKAFVKNVMGISITNKNRVLINSFLKSTKGNPLIHLCCVASAAKGAGTALITYMKQKQMPIILSSLEDARGFHEKMGFVNIANTDVFFWIPEESVEESIHFTLPISCGAKEETYV